jgi:DNA-binding transcriptional ArsR family regulator
MVRAGAPGVTDVFGVLGHPMRRTMIRQLAHGECTVGDLARVHDVTRPAVSQHLRLMLSLGVVAERRSGRERRYRLVAGALDEVRDYLTDLDAFWAQRLLALAQLLEAGPSPEQTS